LRSASSYRKRIVRGVKALATQMKHIVQDNWQQRTNPVVTNDVIRQLYGDNCTFLIDTFPIRVRRPNKRKWRLALYQGKYKVHRFDLPDSQCPFTHTTSLCSLSQHCVVKIQLGCNHAGLPIILSGLYFNIIR
jgi:hypothetical protein